MRRDRRTSPGAGLADRRPAPADADPADDRGDVPVLMGGVTSWCDLLVRRLVDFDWQVLPIIAAHGRPPLFEVPEHARSSRRSSCGPSASRTGGRSANAERRAGVELPALLVRGLIAWDGDAGALLEALTWCRRHPAGVRRAFRSRPAWQRSARRSRRSSPSACRRPGRRREVDLVEASLLYQSLYWVARTAAVETPATDVLLVRRPAGPRSRRSCTRRCTARR